MYTHDLKDIKNNLEIDWQLMATELDTSVNRMKCISNTLLDDCLSLECFEKFVNEIENINGSEVVSLNDNAIIYNYDDEYIVIYTILGDKYILFDGMIRYKMERGVKRYM